MINLTECVVDILRRCGPGALPQRELRAELLRRRPPIALEMDKLRLLADQSGDRLRLLEVELDALDNRGGVPMEAWLVLTSPDDAPDSSTLCASLWQSLSALAVAVEKTSRVEVCRWAVKAEEARRITHP